jgi:hypothetical protein
VDSEAHLHGHQVQLLRSIPLNTYSQIVQRSLEQYGLIIWKIVSQIQSCTPQLQVCGGWQASQQLGDLQQGFYRW